MHKVQAEFFFEWFNMTYMEFQLNKELKSRPDYEDERISNSYKITMLDNLIPIASFCLRSGLNCSLSQASDILEKLQSEDYLYSSLMEDLFALHKSIKTELKTSLFMVIPYDDAVKYYEKPNLFGENVSDNFQSASFDIEEAGKCFATARYTACVMHLQRALEIGFKAYGSVLNVTYPKPQPSWQDIINKTAKEIKDRNDSQKPNQWTSPQEKDFCESIQPFLVSVKDAWRNPSMHADAKYTKEIAEEIFSAVKRFMRNLAEHLDESGTFTP